VNLCGEHDIARGVEPQAFSISWHLPGACMSCPLVPGIGFKAFQPRGAVPIYFVS
jgi:hypothetical protein